MATLFTINDEQIECYQSITLTCVCLYLRWFKIYSVTLMSKEAWFGFYIRMINSNNSRK
jgi:hypothetical protein